MGKGRFVNQKLGKNVSRKFDLLKSELAGRANRKSLSRPLNLPRSQEGNLPGKAVASATPVALLPRFRSQATFRFSQLPGSS